MLGHPRCHERRRAVAIHSDAWDIEASEDRNDATDVVTLLAAGKAAAADEVFDGAAVELWNLFKHLGHDVGSKVIGPDIDEGTLASPTDRRAAQSDDHSFSHAVIMD
jgi:hypothetical protein